MPKKDDLHYPTIKIVLVKRIRSGAATAFCLIALFLAGVNDPKPEWGKFWLVKPLLIVPIAGAMGGAWYHFIMLYFAQAGWKKALFMLVSLTGYVVLLWLGTVLGLNGTLWD